MPKPIVCLSEQLRQFVEHFRPCFSRGQWRYFVIVLLGLIECEERKTLTGVLWVIGEAVSLSGLSRFLSQWRWSTAAVAQTWWRLYCERMAPLVQAEHARLKAARARRVGRPKDTVVTGYLVFDDSVHTKPKGRAMGGLGRHYANTERKVEGGQGALLAQRVVCAVGAALPPGAAHVLSTAGLRSRRAALLQQFERVAKDAGAGQVIFA